MTLDEFATLVRLFGDRVRVGPEGEVTVEREAPPSKAPDVLPVTEHGRQKGRADPES